MNRRLYFVLPDVASAYQTFRDMLLARVNASNVHFLARSGINLGDLPEATVSERTDMFEGLGVGMVLGALLGLIAGALAVWIPPWPFTTPVPMDAIPICILLGSLAGGAWTSITATSIPDSKLESFQVEIAQGKVLMMVHVPYQRLSEIKELVTKTHPEINYGGAWPAEHVVFP
jgi:hypothetical protein